MLVIWYFLEFSSQLVLHLSQVWSLDYVTVDMHILDNTVISHAGVVHHIHLRVDRPFGTYHENRFGVSRFASIENSL